MTKQSHIWITDEQYLKFHINMSTILHRYTLYTNYNIMFQNEKDKHQVVELPGIALRSLRGENGDDHEDRC